jgi:hypothetical protein
MRDSVWPQSGTSKQSANPLVQVDVNGLSCDGAPNKCKGDAEAPPKRTTAKKGDDLGKMADNAGMEKNHLENLSKRSQTNGEIIIVRGSNPASLPHHGKPGHVPKGVDCKLKTAKPPDPHAGLVKKPNPMSPDDAKHVKELEGKGWKFDEDGVAHDPNGNKVYGDHDLQGAYHKDEFGGTTSKVNTNDPNYQNGLHDDALNDPGREPAATDGSVPQRHGLPALDVALRLSNRILFRVRHRCGLCVVDDDDEDDDGFDVTQAGVDDEDDEDELIEIDEAFIDSIFFEGGDDNVDEE